jgi:hypothetical protein
MSDMYRQAHKISHLFWLAIDTEGHDPAVLRGAEKALKAGKVEVLQVRLGSLVVFHRETPSSG